MKRFREFIYDLHPNLLCCISAPLTIAQIILAFVLRRPDSEAMRWIGWILWWTSVVFGWLLMCISLILITQHWVSIALGIPAMVLIYLDLLRVDQCLVGKFGDAYRRYMEIVPQENFVAGIIQLARHRIGR